MLIWLCEAKFCHTQTHTHVQWMIYSTKFTYRDLFPQSSRQLWHRNTSPAAAATVQYLLVS